MSQATPVNLPFKKKQTTIPTGRKGFLGHTSGIDIHSFPQTIPTVPLFRVWRLLSNTLETTYDGRNVRGTACLTTYLPWSPFVCLWAGAHSLSDSIGGKVLCSKRGETCRFWHTFTLPENSRHGSRTTEQCLQQEMCGQCYRFLDYNVEVRSKLRRIQSSLSQASWRKRTKGRFTYLSLRRIFVWRAAKRRKKSVKGIIMCPHMHK